MSVTWGGTVVEGKDSLWPAFELWFTKIEAHSPYPSPEIIAKAQLRAADFRKQEGAKLFDEKGTTVRKKQ